MFISFFYSIIGGAYFMPLMERYYNNYRFNTLSYLIDFSISEIINGILSIGLFGLKDLENFQYVEY